MLFRSPDDAFPNEDNVPVVPLPPRYTCLLYTSSVDADTVNDATSFLETFFKLYPTATEKELAYYVSGNVLEPVSYTHLQITYALRPKITYAGKAVKLHKQTLNETITAVRSVKYVPDKIY